MGHLNTPCELCHNLVEAWDFVRTGYYVHCDKRDTILFDYRDCLKYDYDPDRRVQQ